MQIRWRWQPELALQPDLARRRCKQISAAHYMRDLLGSVVDDDRELIGEDSVGALDDEIADVAIQALLLPTLQAVVKTNRLAANHESPRAALAARRDTVAAGAGIPALAAGAERCGFELPARAGAGENPAAGVELPEKKAVREKHVLTPEQISQLLSVFREPVRTMFLLAVLTGLRIGEVIGLRWRDIDLDSGQLRVEQACYRGHLGSPKTQGSKRCLPLPLGLVEMLVHYHRRCLCIGPDDLLFQSCSGKPLSDTNLLHRHLKPAGHQIGAPWLNWHTLRRTHATLLQSAGGSLKDAQAQLGHSKLSTTLEIYTVPIPSQQRAAVEKLCEVLLTNVDEKKQLAKELPAGPQQIQ